MAPYLCRVSQLSRVSLEYDLSDVVLVLGVESFLLVEGEDYESDQNYS